MDDTQNNNQNPQPVNDGAQPVMSQDSTNVATPMVPLDMTQSTSMGDIAGMTPPLAPPAPMADNIQQQDGMGMVQPSTMQTPSVQPMLEPAPVAPIDMSSQMPSTTSLQMDSPTVGSMPSYSSQNMMSGGMLGAPTHHEKPEDVDDYTYAEDLLDEILDSLDRIEAKLGEIEKKVG